jgi:hypothetical protein
MNDKFARVTAVISLLWGFGTFGYDHFRGPDLTASPGKYVYIQGRPSIGVPMGFFNGGTKAAIINTGELTLDDGSNKFKFKLTLFSSSTEKWTYDSGTKSSIPAAFSLFSQVVTKPGDATEGVFWYSPELADFKFQADRKYTASLKFGRREQSDSGALGQTAELCGSIVVFHLESTTATNAAQHPEVVNPVKTD